MTLPDPPSLSFDDVVIDFTGRRVLRKGEATALEPKAFDVLALLAGEPGRAFSRDEILDAVWGHRHVTPGVLNRIITLLRHALGEDAHHPHLLHTLHGVGYRFDLPAVPPSLVEPAALEAKPEAVSPMRVSHRHVEDLAPERSPARAVFWLAPLLVVLAAAGWRLWPRAESTPATTVPVPVEAAAMPTLVVLPLKPIGNTASCRELADGLGEELIGSLAQIDGLRVIARESTAIAASESLTLVQLTQRLGITHALEGSLQQAGQRLRIRLRLIKAGSGHALWARDFDRDASEVLVLQREIAQAVATSLTLKMGLAAGPVTKSGDTEFLLRYLAAQALLRQPAGTIDQTVEPAEAEFRALIRERPDDARVHAGLALALGFRAYRRPQLAVALRAESMQEAAIAQRLDETLPEPYFLQAAEACRSNRWEPCLALLEKTTALSPNFYPARYQLAMAMAQLGYLDRAEAIAREDMTRDPIHAGKRYTLGRILDTQGRHEEAHAQFERSDSFATYGRWFNAVWRGDYAAATRIADHDFDSEALADTRAGRLKPSYVASSRALVDPARWPEAEAEMLKFEQDTGLMNFCRVLMPDASTHAAELIPKLDVLRERSYSSWDLLLWTKDLAYLRRDPAFQDYLRDNGILAYWRKHGFPKQCRPQSNGVACE